MDMGYKALILADLHLHHLPQWRFQWCEKFIDNILKTKQGMKVKLVLLGDVLELRDKVDSRVANLLFKLIGGWNCGDVIWLTGQHDSYLPNRATFEGLEGYELKQGRLKIIDRKILEDRLLDVWFVPYCREEEDYRKMLEEVPDNATIFTHLPVKEVIESFGGQDVCGISQEEFNRFNLVISGDIHKHCRFGKIEYVGAPSQRDWRDKGVEGQIGWWENGKFKREATEHPIHIEIESEDEIPSDKECIIKMPRGLRLSKEKTDNIISKIETAKTDFESIKTSYKKEDTDNLLKGYLSSNVVNKKDENIYLKKGKSYIEE